MAANGEALADLVHVDGGAAVLEGAVDLEDGEARAAEDEVAGAGLHEDVDDEDEVNDAVAHEERAERRAEQASYQQGADRSKAVECQAPLL